MDTPTVRSAPLAVGDSAPAFRLRRTFAEDFAWGSDRPLVLVFYVFDFGNY